MQGIYYFGAGGTFDFDITFNPATNKIVSEIVTAKSGINSFFFCARFERVM